MFQALNPEKSLLIQFVMFSFKKGIDVKSMGRIFIGLVKCGAWGCFDEFNRLQEAVLSAVSMQIQSIQAAIKKKEKSIELLGRNVSLYHALHILNVHMET